MNNFFPIIVIESEYTYWKISRNYYAVLAYVSFNQTIECSVSANLSTQSFSFDLLYKGLGKQRMATNY